MSDYYLLLYMGIDVCQITIYCSTGGLMCVRLLSTVVQGGLVCVRLLSTVVQGGLVCVRLLSTVVHGN